MGLNHKKEEPDASSSPKYAPQIRTAIHIISIHLMIQICNAFDIKNFFLSNNQIKCLSCKILVALSVCII